MFFVFGFYEQATIYQMNMRRGTLVFLWCEARIHIHLRRNVGRGRCLGVTSLNKLVSGMAKIARMQNLFMVGHVSLGGGIFISVEDGFPALILKRKIPDGMWDHVLRSRGIAIKSVDWNGLVQKTGDIIARNHHQAHESCIVIG